MKKNYLFLFTILIGTAECGLGQVKPIENTNAQQFKVVNRALTAAPENAMHMDERDGAGIAWLTGKTFINGTIEFDVKGKDIPQKSFVGIAFHGVNDSTYEAIYFRPFNFKAQDPVRKSHGVQYIAIPGYDWPKLREEFPNKYEQPVLPETDPNGWVHTRITVNGKQISVYVNGNEKPSLVVTSLVDFKGQQIGYWVGNGSGGDWKNFKISPAK